MPSITELEHLSVAERAAEIGCPVPEIAVMPDNFGTAHSQRELRIRREAIALRSILVNANFPLGSFCSVAEHASFGKEDFMHWEASLFISYALLKREPYVAAVALSIIKDHLSDYFSEEPGRTARFSLIIERSDRTCRKLAYEGDIGGLGALAQTANKIAAE